MRSVLLIFSLILAGIAPLRAQMQAAQYRDIFKSYLLQQDEHYGLFDSTDSYFIVHFDSVVQSPFDSFAFLAGGKIWHRSQITSFKAYIDADTATEILMPLSFDGDINLHWAMNQQEMLVPGTKLMQCSGEINMIENDSSEYSGVFSGIFTSHFYFRPKTQYVKALPAIPQPDLEPGFYTTGFWSSEKKPHLGTIPFAFSNSEPFPTELGEALADLRFTADGNITFSNFVQFETGTVKLPLNWYK